MISLSVLFAIDSLNTEWSQTFSGLYQEEGQKGLWWLRLLARGDVSQKESNPAHLLRRYKEGRETDMGTGRFWLLAKIGQKVVSTFQKGQACVRSEEYISLSVTFNHYQIIKLSLYSQSTISIIITVILNCCISGTHQELS